MSDEALRDLLTGDLSEEAVARSMLNLTLEAAPPEVAQAIRLCALPAWFDSPLLALLGQKEDQQAADLVAQVAEFSFVMPRGGEGYVYHEATRARLLDWWQEPERQERFSILNERLAHFLLNLARQQDQRLKGLDHLAALASLDALYPNLQAAWEGVTATENWELVQEFAYLLADYFECRGLWDAWISWRQAGLEACQRLGEEECSGLQNNLGNAYLRLPTGDRAENLDRAIECYRQALATEYLSLGARSRYLRNLGDAHSELEDYPSAIATYQQAIDLNPDDPWLFNALGNVHSNQEEHEEAVEACTTALALVKGDENQALLYRNRASSLIGLERLDEAERDCNQVHNLDPDHPYTFARLGQLAFARDDYAIALEHYTAAIDRQSEASFHFDRGLTHLALHQLDLALTDYRTALTHTDFITLAEARRELDEFAAEHPHTPGLTEIRTLLRK